MRTAFVFLIPAFFLSVEAPASAATVMDDSGIELRLDRPAQRVISLSPHLTELMYSIGAGDRLAGVVRGSDFPAEAAGLPEIGDASGLDFERILYARPDFVLAWGSGNRSVDIARLRALGLRVLVLEPRQLEDIPRHLRMLGELTGLDEGAQAVARIFERRIGALRDRYAGRAAVQVMFEIWHRPLFTVNRGHIISKVLALCGARNIFAGLPRLAGEISLEQALVMDPDAIVVGSEADDADVNNWTEFSYLKAVRTGSVFAVSADRITRQTPRIVDAAERLCAGIDKARR
ncbi:MAG TPA: cobalamin-binding protein [Burkholderiales bacterium]|nr:cobalamin-binding protein [Burkholderiales bacterium]